MHYCRFEYQGSTGYGLIEDVADTPVVTRVLARAPRAFSDFRNADKAEILLSAVRLLAPVEPTKIVCIGRNYREHAKELNHPIPAEPLFFLKPPSSVLAPGGTVLRPASLSQRVDHEG